MPPIGPNKPEQAIGLPPSMTLFAFVGVVVTSASAIIYGQPEWDPVQLAGKFQNKFCGELCYDWYHHLYIGHKYCSQYC